MTQTANLDVIVAPEPFAPRVERMAVPDIGLNVARILAAACNNGALSVDDLRRTRVYVNGVDLAEALGEGWLDYVPEEGEIVNVVVQPLGGGGDSKVLQTVLAIAVIALSLWVGSPNGALEGSKLLVRAGAAAAVQIGGTLLINALFRPESPEAAPEANSRQALQGATNEVRLRGPMPLRLGRQRVPYDIAAAPYTELVGQDVWLTVGLGVHYGPCANEDIKVGETLLADYPAADYQIETFLTPGPRTSTLYPGRMIQENFTDELSDDVGEVHTTAANAERTAIDLAWPAGLSYTSNKGVFSATTAHILVQYKAVGSPTWLPAPLPTAYAPGGGALTPGSWITQLATRDSYRATIPFEFPAKGQYDVRVTKVKNHVNDSGGGQLVDKVYWTALKAISSEKPFEDETLSVVVLKIKSSDDLNGNLPTISGVVTPIVPVWNGSDWETEAPSSNPAALARWLLSGPAAAIPIDPAEQINDSVIDAFELIAANHWDNVAVDVSAEASQEDVLQRLGLAGRFATYWNGRQLCFVPDWEKPAPRQMFTGRNAQGYRYRRTFPDELHCVIVEFFPLDLTSPANERKVYADGYDETNAELFETLRLDFSCDAERAFKEGRAYLARRALQVEVHEWQAGIDAVATTFGDRVLVSHPAALFGTCRAYVDHRTWSGGLVSGFKLDDAVAFEPGRDYGVDIRRADRTIRGVPIINPGVKTRTVQFATPRTAEDAPEKGDLVVVGELGVTTEDLEIVDIQASSDGTVTFKGFRYIGEELQQAETGEIPDFDNGLAPRPAAPVPRIIAAEGSPDGVSVVFDIDPVRATLVSGFTVRWRVSGLNDLGQEYPWQALRPLGPGERSFKTPPPSNATGGLDETGEYHPAVEVDIELRSVINTGSVSQAARVDGVDCVRGVPDVEGLSAIGMKRTAPDNSSYPVIEIGAVPYLDGTVQDLVVEMRPAGGSAEDWEAAATYPAAMPFGDVTQVKGGQEYDIRARWRTADNWVGDWALVLAVEVPLNSLVSAGVAQIGGLTPTELLEELNGVVAQGYELVDRVRQLAEAALEYGVGLWQETEFRDESDVKYGRYFRLLGAENETQTAWVFEESTVLLEDGLSLATYRTGVQASLGDNAAAIVTESVARATADGAMATQISTLQVQASGFSGSITTLQSVVSGLGAQWTVALNVNGHVSGIYQYNSGSASSIIFSATQIGFSNGPSTVYPLAIVGGVVKATNFEADRVKANSIEAANIIGGEITDSVASVSGATIGLSVGSWTNLRSVSYYSRGGRLEIYTQSTTLSASTDSYASYRVVIDGVVQDDWPNYIKGGAYDRSVSITNASPSAGWHTIDFEGKLEPGSGAASSVNQSVFLTEHKTET